MSTDTQHAIQEVIDMAYFEASQDFACGDLELAAQKSKMIKSVGPLMKAAPALLDVCIMCEFFLSELEKTNASSSLAIAIKMTRGAIRQAGLSFENSD